jgi:hypothetical protein
MLSTASGRVAEVVGWWGDDVQELRVDVAGVLRKALCYVDISGVVEVGDPVLLNTTAQTLNLGTGGFDFVTAVGDLSKGHAGIIPLGLDGSAVVENGHIIKARYTPCQLSVLTLEEQAHNAWMWERNLEGMPVLAGQLHSQMIPAAAGLRAAGCAKVVYVMTDAAALPIAFSNAVRAAKKAELIDASITCGQAFGGDYETVTLHSALIAARHLLKADAVIVCQGPGNAGTGTKYGFSGVEQASVLDTSAALGGRPIAIVRVSEGDKRARHSGISHHTLTSLTLVRSSCLVPLPAGIDGPAIEDRHDLRIVDGVDAVVDHLALTDLPLTTMGRSVDKDRVFFLAAAAAGLAVATI